jgi:hypothetical protein
MRDPAYVVDVHMSQYQPFDTIQWEIDLHFSIAFTGICALKHTAINEHRSSIRKEKLMARSCDTCVPAVMNNLHE